MRNAECGFYYWLESFLSDVNPLEEIKEMLWWYKVLAGPKPTGGSFRLLSRLTNWPNIWSLTFLCCLGRCTALTKKCKPKRPPESRRVERTSKVQFHLFLQSAVLRTTDHLLILGIFTVFENHQKVSFQFFRLISPFMTNFWNIWVFVPKCWLYFLARKFRK